MSDEAITPAKLRADYERGVSYNQSQGLYEQVRQNERFYEGDHWNGLKSVTIKPVTVNILRLVVSYFVSMIVSDDVGIEVRPFAEGAQAETAARVLEESCKRVMERAKLKSMNREMVRDAAVDGGAALYFWFDPEIENGQLVRGDIQCESIQNTNIIFGNPHCADVQAQPYLILVRRRHLSLVREDAQANGVKDTARIVPDTGRETMTNESEDANLVTELTRFWKARGADGRRTVRYMTVAGDVVTREETDTGYTLYPIAYWVWDKRKNSCQGVSPLTSNIHTQIAINRMWTGIAMHVYGLGFPKILYDRTKITRWTGEPGQSVGVVGDPREAATAVAGGVALPPGIIDVVRSLTSQMRDAMGANDAALGNVRADNQGAIIALQKASAAPLELQKLAFYQFVEDYVRVLVDMMCARYGERDMTIDEEATNPITGQTLEGKRTVRYDFGALALSAMTIHLDVGAAVYWSELQQIQTADNLFSKGIFTDPASYLENVPDELVRGKKKLIRALRATQKAQQAQMPQAPGGSVGSVGSVEAELRHR